MGLSELLATYGRNYWEALLSTWGMTALCFALVMLVAIAVTVMRVSPFKPLRVLGDGYVQVFRNIPGVSLLIIIVYALPSLNLVLPYRTCVILTVILVASAFGSENFTSGINTIGVGQIEAARSLGLSFGQMLRRIVIPQAIRYVIPSLISQLVVVVKDTTVAYVVSYPDMLQNARVLITNYDALVSTYLVVAVIYILLNYAINQLSVYVARRSGTRVVSRYSTNPA